MFGTLGVAELLFIFGLALLIFGPKQLPQVGRALGRGMAELRKASADFQRTINAEIIAEEVREADPRRHVRDSLKDVKENLEKAARGEVDRPQASPSPSGAVARGGSTVEEATVEEPAAEEEATVEEATVEEATVEEPAAEEEAAVEEPADEDLASADTPLPPAAESGVSEPVEDPSPTTSDDAASSDGSAAKASGS